MKMLSFLASKGSCRRPTTSFTGFRVPRSEGNNAVTRFPSAPHDGAVFSSRPSPGYE